MCGAVAGMRFVARTRAPMHQLVLSSRIPSGSGQTDVIPRFFVMSVLVRVPTLDATRPLTGGEEQAMNRK